MKRIVALIAVVPIAFVLLLSCKPENQDPEPTRDVEYSFDSTNMDQKLTDLDALRNLANDKTIRYIYLFATGHWDGMAAKNISLFRKNGLQPCLELSPKVRGRGNFDFKLGEASKVPEDSLWYVQNGWTINK